MANNFDQTGFFFITYSKLETLQISKHSKTWQKELTEIFEKILLVVYLLCEFRKRAYAWWI